MKKQMFDDQHQKMSSWLDKLATTEAANYSKSDLKEDDTVEKQAADFNGISSTWNTKKDVNTIVLDDNSRKIANKPQPKVSMIEVEKQARQLLMTGLNIEKIATVLKKKYSKNIVDKFIQTNLAAIESEFGKLGCLYVDASLVSNCSDLSNMIKSSTNRVASIAIKSVKKIDKCADCNFNKRSHCLKLSLDIVDQPEIKTAKEAKTILNKFASLKYVNSYFVKSAELAKYYERLASENPEKVIRDFLIDIQNRRAAKQSTNLRLAVNESVNFEAKKKANLFKLGKDDFEVENAFKQFLIKDQSLRTAKSTLIKRYGSNRVKVYLKEAKSEIEKYIKFISAKTKITNQRSKAIESKTELMNKQSSNKIASATKMAYSLRTFRIPLADIRKNISKTFGADVAETAINKLSSDNEARLLGLTYIDSNLYSSPNEIKDVLNILKKKGNTVIYQIREGRACKLENNPEGVCSVTGLKIVKNASIDSKEQAQKLISKLASEKFANDYELNKLAVKFVDGDNSNVISSFIISRKPAKIMTQKVVRSAAEIAFKYAKDKNSIKRISKMQWSSPILLSEALADSVINKQAFIDEVSNVFNRSASDANVYLNQPNQYNINLFSNEKGKVSDAILGSTI